MTSEKRKKTPNNKGTRQIIAEKISSTVRVLELLGYEYEVKGPRRTKEQESRSPRVVWVKSKSIKDEALLRVYNGVLGNTWAHFAASGEPVPGVDSVEALFNYLLKLG